MKTLKFTFALLACAILSSCSNDDNTTEDLVGQTGNLVLKFDNSVGDQQFVFGTTYNRANGESYKLTTLKYMISNISLKDNAGNTFTYEADEDVFIVDEADGNNASEIWVTLPDVDAANYTQITFGVGIDQEQYESGAEGQGAFLDTAQDEGMLWSWATGFRFVRLDGTFSGDTTTDGDLNIHMGSVGTAIDNYRDVTLDFTNTVLVRTDKQPEVHITADISKIFDGDTTVSFEDGYSQVHTDATTTPVIADNMSAMFEVHHVHND